MNEKTNSQNPPVVDDADDLPEQLRIRRSKRAAIIERGVEPYPVEVPRTKSIKEIRETHKDLAIDVATGTIESIAKYCVPKSDRSIPSKGPATYVLELIEGFCDIHNVEVGDRIDYKQTDGK